ITNRYKQ
ncbi:hypothetical protein CP8484711_0136, partial [Chlamydia psittaci 84-8471/1]